MADTLAISGNFFDGGRFFFHKQGLLYIVLFLIDRIYNVNVNFT